MLTDAEKLKVYDLLREAHKSIKQIIECGLLEGATEIQDGAIGALDVFLYMAEGEFARMSD